MVSAGAVELGSGAFRYEALATWERLPEGMTLHECAGVAVDAEDLVYLLTRNVDNPVIVLEPGGGRPAQLRGGRVHGPHARDQRRAGRLPLLRRRRLAHDHEVDARGRTRAHDRRAGGVLGAAQRRALQPPDGRRRLLERRLDLHQRRLRQRAHPPLLGRGRTGAVLGRGRASTSVQFMVPHNLAIDEDDRIYVADRESHRVQIFDRDGGPLAMWNNIHRPCGMTMGGDGLLYVGELNGVALMDGALGVGHRVSIYSRRGRTAGAARGIPRRAKRRDASSRRTGWRWTRAATSTSPRSRTRSVAATSDPPRELRSIKKLRRLE